ncbi:methyltransferase domain-containing protein [Bradyrhizobium sp. LHD-71]|uniref:methyltransferase domain-containing protein n=1 Tax=Bradyrhizobium sp. LHD-71 TaxID=3072141 RepID=UPI00280DA34F|nr:methyltransferase domain-containing protein [Bradyrhizobium sp. LHD-71]MDQ8730361.1 methyltransferase domain-containing protein [Bradyrhizobium sp. LHD-71]
MQPFFVTSGNVTADRRYEFAQQYFRRGDLDAAADVMAQAVELAPDFAAAWFALGEIHDARGQREQAITAFRKAREHDVEDRHGAALHLMRLGAEQMGAMPEAYVRTLFDQYAPEFNRALLETLNYRGPRIVRDAVREVLRAAGRSEQFRRAIDLGCGTGLAARAFARSAVEIIGYDLSPGMVGEARQTGLYDRLEVADMVKALQGEADGSADLIFSADAVVYLADLAPLFCEVARVLSSDGLFACTLETHEGDGVILGVGLRYQHNGVYLRQTLQDAGLRALHLAIISTRDESGVPVPGIVVVAMRAGPDTC